MALDQDFMNEIDAATTTAAETSKTAVKEEGSGTGNGAPFVPTGENDNGGNTDEGSGGAGSTGEAGGAGTEGQGGAGTGSEGGDGANGDRLLDGTSEGGKTSDALDAGSGVTPVSAETIAAAAGLGLRLDEIVALGDESRAKEVIVRMTANAKTTAEAEAAAEAERKRAEDRDEAMKLPELDPEENDPKVIEAFNQMQTTLKSQQEQIDRFQAAQEAQQRQVTESQQREIRDWFGTQVEALKTELGDVLNDESKAALSLDGRIGDAIANRMSVDLAGYNATGQVAPPRETVFADAARLVLRDEYAKLEAARVSEEVEKRTGLEISKPGGTHSKQDQSPEDETAALIDKRFFGK